MSMGAYFPEAPKLGFRPNSCPLRCILTKTACSWGLEKTLTINCDAMQQLNSTLQVAGSNAQPVCCRSRPS